MIFDKNRALLLAAALTLSAATFGLTGEGHKKALNEARAEATSISDYPLATHTWRMVYDVADLDYGDHFIFATKGSDNVWRALDDRAEHHSFPDSNSFTVELDYANKVFAVDEFVSGANPGIYTLEHAAESKPGIKFGSYSYSYYPNGSSYLGFLFCKGGGQPRNVGLGVPYSLSISWTGAVTTRMYYESWNSKENAWRYVGGNLRAICEKDGTYYLYDGDSGYIDESGTYHAGAQPAPVYDPELPIYIFKIEDGIVNPPARKIQTLADFPLSTHTYRMVYDDSDLSYGDNFIFAMKDANGVYRAMGLSDDPKFLASDTFTVERDYKNRVFAIDQFAPGAKPAIWTLDYADEYKPGKKFGPWSFKTWVGHDNSYDQEIWMMGSGGGTLWMVVRGLPASFDIDNSTGAVTTRFYGERQVGRDANNNSIWAYFGGDVRVISNDNGVTYVPVDYTNNCLDEDGNVGHIEGYFDFVPGAVAEYEYTTPTYDLYIFKVEDGIVSQPALPAHVTYTVEDFNYDSLEVFGDPEPRHSMNPYYGGWNGGIYISSYGSYPEQISHGNYGQFTFSLTDPFTILGFSFSAKIGKGSTNTGSYVFYDDPGAGLSSGTGNFTEIFRVDPNALNDYSDFVIPMDEPIEEPGGGKTKVTVNCTEGDIFIRSFTVYYKTAYTEFSNSVDVTSNLSFNYLMEGDEIISISNISLKFRCDIPNSTLANISNTTGFGATVTAEGSEHSMNFAAGTDKISTSETGKYFTFSINNVPSAALKTELTITPYINADIGGETKTIYLPEKTMSIKRLVEAYTGESASLLTELQAALIGQFAAYFAAELAD